MNIFDVINEVAVLATTLLMMAVATVWYSEVLFGKMLMGASSVQKESTDKNKSNTLLILALTFISYFVILAILAYLIALSPLLPASPFVVAIFAVAFALALGILPVVSEGRPFPYYLVNGGFVSLFIVGGTFVLHYWPW